MVYMVTWIPSIYPSHVSIFLPAPWIRHGGGFSIANEMVKLCNITGGFSHGFFKAALLHPASVSTQSTRNYSLAALGFFWNFERYMLYQ